MKIQTGTLVKLKNRPLKDDMPYVVLGVVDNNLIYLYPYFGDKLINFTLLPQHLKIYPYKSFDVEKIVGYKDFVKAWFLKNRLLMNRNLFPDLQEELDDKRVREYHPVVGRQYLGLDGRYRIYLGYNYYLLLGYKPTTNEEFDSMTSYNVYCYSVVSRYYVDGFKIKLKEYPELVKELKRTKEQKKSLEELMKLC